MTLTSWICTHLRRERPRPVPMRQGEKERGREGGREREARYNEELRCHGQGVRGEERSILKVGLTLGEGHWHTLQRTYTYQAHNCTRKYIILTSMSGCMCVCVCGGRNISTMCHIVMVTVRGAINTTQICYIRKCPAVCVRVCVCACVLYLRDISRLPSTSGGISFLPFPLFFLPFFASHSPTNIQRHLCQWWRKILCMDVWRVEEWRVEMAKRLFICQKINVFSLLASFRALTSGPSSLISYSSVQPHYSFLPLSLLAAVWPPDTKR